ncbi:sidestep protein, putative [Ixodes scapularis]|uniref:Sidestep protein, putative n=1 Tax=Ixodes scapularis TaxID=6945 RepID=B7PK10_IXOSC|nr:sidestep protein, putative [Ixodes scapularis]|eukprot:XP_002409095.1 sidestep protein, putative [Ixodes scapularis]
MGDPPPQVTWSKDGNVIDDTFTVTPQGFVRNELRLGPLRRPDLMAQLVCTASNNNATLPLSSRVSLDINLKPTEVKIGVPRQPAAAGDRVELRCLATGARPFAQVTWFKGGQRLTQVEDFVSTATNSTVSSVSFIVAAEDNGRNVTCRADNPHLPKSEVSDTVVLNVHYAPQLTLTTVNRRPLEGDNVTLVCAVNANPAASAVSWRHGGRVLDVRNDSLLLSRVGRRQAGSYECIASNVIGEGFSNKLHLSVLYAPVCVEGLTREYAASADIRVLVACEVNASPGDVHFEWVANTTLRTGRISSFTANGTKSYASTVTGTELEYGILLCFASNNVGKQIEPCTFRIVPPGPPGSPENCTVVNLSPDSVLLKCSAGSSGGLQPVFQAEVFSVHADLLHNNISSSRQPHFKLSGLHKDTSFVALVYAANAKGRSSPVTVRFATGLLNSFPSATGVFVREIL